ncbi:M56 family metallopeptidase [Rubritalea sp.]|uniref:M56 family metallopeptidase n=1 Tax=Rubritalea sp. TaxID=2109375 RepID=UPI003F4ADED5
MVLLLLFSPLFLLVPKWEIPVGFISSETITSSTWDLPTLLLTYWIAGSSVTLIFYCIQALQLSQWVDRTKHIHSGSMSHELELAAKQSRLKSVPALRISTEAHSPIVTGVFRPTIILPQYALHWDNATLRMVYLHELGHIQRRDLWLSLAAQVNCVLYWWNPLVWMLKSNLRYQCEFAVDAAILDKGVDSKSYITALCNVAEEMLKNRPLLCSTLSMAYQSSLRKRVNTLSRSQENLHPVAFKVFTLISICTTVAVATTATSPIEQNQAYSNEDQKLRLSATPFPADI